MTNILHKLPKQLVIVAQNDLSFISVFCSQKQAAFSLRISLLKFGHTYLHNQLKQNYTEKINSHNNNDKAKKPTLGNHSISINCCNIFAYFCVANNKIKAALSFLSMFYISHLSLNEQCISTVCSYNEAQVIKPH